MWKKRRHKYVNSHYMDRISGMFFDVMIVAGIAAIDWQDLSGILIPVLIVCLIGGLATFYYIRYVCEKYIHIMNMKHFFQHLVC